MQTIDKFITSHFLYDDSILFGSLPYCWSGFINCILQGILELLILFRIIYEDQSYYGEKLRNWRNIWN